MVPMVVTMNNWSVNFHLAHTAYYFIDLRRSIAKQKKGLKEKNNFVLLSYDTVDNFNVFASSINHEIPRSHQFQPVLTPWIILQKRRLSLANSSISVVWNCNRNVNHLGKCCLTYESLEHTKKAPWRIIYTPQILSSVLDVNKNLQYVRALTCFPTKLLLSNLKHLRFQ